MKGDVKLSAGGATHVALPDSRRNAASEERDRERLAFAYLTLQAVVQHLRPQETSRGAATATNESAPAPTGESDLAASPSQGALGIGKGEAASSPRRISVEMQAGELGRVAISIDRGPDGLAVNLMIENTQAAQLASLQRKSLLTALESHGMTVTAMNVIGGAKTGIPLADAMPNGVSGQSRNGSVPGKPTTDEDGKKSIGLRKRLKLMG